MNNKQITIIDYRGISIQQEWVLPAIINQLNKDFELSGVDVEFDNTLNLQDFHQSLLSWVESALEKDNDQLMNFLYRVDVNQTKIHSNDGLPQWNLTKLLIEREFQKVVLRKEFTS